MRKAHGFSEENMPQVQRTIPYTFDAYSGGVIKDPGRGKLPDFATGSSGRLSQLGDNQVRYVLVTTRSSVPRSTRTVRWNALGRCSRTDETFRLVPTSSD